MEAGVDECKNAVNCGHWPLYRFDPRRTAKGENPLQLDSKAPSITFEEFAYGENRFRVLKKTHPEAAKALMVQANAEVKAHFDLYRKLAGMDADCGKEDS